MIEIKKKTAAGSVLAERIARIRIRTKMLLLILLTGTGCLLLFRFLWLQKWDVWGLLAYDFPVRLNILPMPSDDFFEKMAEEALKYNIPESEDDEDAVEAIAPLFDLADDYTAMYLYGAEDGMFRTGYMPEIMNTDPFRTFFDIGYDWTDGSVEQTAAFPLQFKNGYGTMHISFYHSSCFIYPYFLFCLTVCIALFVFINVYYVNKKMKTVIMLKESVLQMSSGDLSTPVPCRDKDELGILSQELDRMRITLYENFRQEQELHKSNRELTAALSHDLRTPLTILKGYLEILRLNRQKEMQAEYIRRCLRKADDIQEMTDRMFEYALVYENTDSIGGHAILSEIPLDSILDSLREHEDFLHLAGFSTSCQFSDLPDSRNVRIMAEPAMLKRVWNNLFSNIIKYADKKETVCITVSAGQNLTVVFQNRIKPEYDETESTKIGLKSVRRMMEFMDGTLVFETENSRFTARLKFPVIDAKDGQ